MEWKGIVDGADESVENVVVEANAVSKISISSRIRFLCPVQTNERISCDRLLLRSSSGIKVYPSFVPLDSSVPSITCVANRAQILS